jgi:signal transduction histidine kinase
MSEATAEITVALVAGSVIFLILSGIVIFVLLYYQKKRFSHHYQMQEEILKAKLETQERTFRQIADELHDNVGQLLSSVNILLTVTQKKMNDPPQTLLTAAETLSKAMQDLRALSKSLNLEWLQKFNLIDNLQAEADRINIARDIVVNVNPDIRQLPVSPEAQVMLFRIVQEALQNAIKHACARNIDIYIITDETWIRISVHDDGKGFTPDPQRSQGLGLLNMRHRTGLLGGSIEWSSAAGEGTRVEICLPILKQVP